MFLVLLSLNPNFKLDYAAISVSIMQFRWPFKYSDQ